MLVVTVVETLWPLPLQLLCAEAVRARWLTVADGGDGADAGVGGFGGFDAVATAAAVVCIETEAMELTDVT